MPKLACDQPSPDQIVDYYTIAGIPGDPRVDRLRTGPHGFEYELKDLPSGAYSIQCSACNKWTCSLPAPLEFTVPEQPTTPTGLSILFI
jgi:hypothetical protein